MSAVQQGQSRTRIARRAPTVPFELTKYYRMLFDAKKVRDEEDTNFPELDTLLTKLSGSKIFQSTADHLDRPFTEKEVRSVMENLPLGKQAGPNRVPNGVYKVMANIFVPKFTQLLNESTKPVLPRQRKRRSVTSRGHSVFVGIVVLIHRSASAIFLF